MSSTTTDEETGAIRLDGGVRCSFSINDLPPELLTIIFGYLEVKGKGRAAQVGHMLLLDNSLLGCSKVRAANCEPLRGNSAVTRAVTVILTR